jgi:hypothetical protein
MIFSTNDLHLLLKFKIIIHNKKEMTKIQIQTEIDTQMFLTSVAQIPVNELEYFVMELNALITRRKTNDKAYRDRALLSKINGAILPKGKTERYMLLHLKLEAETISESEYQEFMDLVAQEEELRNERVKYMIELSQLRGITLPQVMNSLGINVSSHG